MRNLSLVLTLVVMGLYPVVGLAADGKKAAAKNAAAQPAAAAAGGQAAASGGRFFEMRIYTAADGKLDALHARFRNHTNGLFVKHGMELVGYWVPTDPEKSKNTLVYILAYPSKDARDASWKAFQSDPEWKKVVEESQRDGKLVANVESTFMTPTDYSPIK